MKACACGCGEKVTPGARYRAGHQWAHLRQSEYAVDETSECWVWQRSTNADGYGHINRAGHSLAHRYYFEMHRGSIPPGMTIDHACRNRACVNPDHLRAVAHAHNMQNRSATGNRNGTSRFRGVSRIGDRWVARAMIDGREHRVGYFESEEEAGRAAAGFRRKHMPFSVADTA